MRRSGEKAMPLPQVKFTENMHYRYLQAAIG